MSKNDNGNGKMGNGKTNERSVCECMCMYICVLSRWERSENLRQYLMYQMKYTVGIWGLGSGTWERGKDDEEIQEF